MKLRRNIQNKSKNTKTKLELCKVPEVEYFKQERVIRDLNASKRLR